ncbi:MAG: fumarylacetoacetate hydrolase family protein [Nitrospirota bacterium]
MDNQQSINRVFCIGLNYREHISELSFTMPTTPVIFMKPASCVIGPGEDIHFPAHGKDFQHEVELVVKVGKKGKPQTPHEAHAMIDSLTIGLDLTLRDLQNDLRKQGMPWEISKAFEQSAPIGTFIPYTSSLNLQNIPFRCTVNGKERQKGNTQSMLFGIDDLLVQISTIWTLLPGDIVFTGTPPGVGPLAIGDVVEIESDLIGKFSWKIVE